MEWIQQRVSADTDTYAQSAIPLFKPTPALAKAWARLAKQAGCKYLVFTTKHHDGFALHDSAVSEFDAGSVLSRDLVQEIVDACRSEGLRVGFYHSVIDWHHDQYAYSESQQLPHPLKGKPYSNGSRRHEAYIDYLHAQVDELASNYGQVDVMWWDYSAQDFQGNEAWRAFELMNDLRDRHPNVIMNNRLFRIPEAGWRSMEMGGISQQRDPKYGDFITPEQHVPDTGIPGVDWETCMTMNTTWGFNEHDHHWKSSEELIRNRIDIASKGGNYLLNIGPKGDGSIPAESVDCMRKIGRWMRDYGEAIYGTTASPIAQPDWGHVTSGEGRVYLHVFQWPSDGRLGVDGLPQQATKATLLQGSENLPIDHKVDSLVLSLPAAPPDPIASFVVVTT